MSDVSEKVQDMVVVTMERIGTATWSVE